MIASSDQATVPEPSAGLRDAISMLGFRDNPGRGVFYGCGRDQGKRFSVSAALGLVYESDIGSLPISSGVAVSHLPELEYLISGGEYDKYRGAILVAMSDGSASGAIFMALLACIEEDSLSYLLAHSTVNSVEVDVLDRECLVR